MRPIIRSLLNNRGVAAVEFAFIAPVLAAICLGVIDTANYVIHTSSMQRGVRAGIQYVMAGGNDTATLTALVNQNWEDRPQGASVVVSFACTCGTTGVSCSATTCSGGGTPQKNETVTAIATVSGVVTTFPQTVAETIRVQ